MTLSCNSTRQTATRFVTVSLMAATLLVSGLLAGAGTMAAQPAPTEGPYHLPGVVVKPRYPTHLLVRQADLTAQRDPFGAPASRGQTPVQVARIRNAGLLDAGAFTVRVQVGARVTTHQYDGLGEDTMTFLTLPPIGSCERVVVTVDAGNTVAESNETNNMLEFYGPCDVR